MQQRIVPVVKAVVVCGQRMLMLRRTQSDPIGGGVWEVPGGKLEFGEHLSDALVREVREETGLHVQPEKLLYAVDFFTHPHRQVVLLAYLCRCDGGEVTLSSEHSEYRWADAAQVQALLEPAILKDFMQHHVLDHLMPCNAK